MLAPSPHSVHHESVWLHRQSARLQKLQHIAGQLWDPPHLTRRSCKCCMTAHWLSQCLSSSHVAIHSLACSKLQAAATFCLQLSSIFVCCGAYFPNRCCTCKQASGSILYICTYNIEAAALQDLQQSVLVCHVIVLAVKYHVSFVHHQLSKLQPKHVATPIYTAQLCHLLQSSRLESWVQCQSVRNCRT